jgi:hypothetical protein
MIQIQITGQRRQGKQHSGNNKFTGHKAKNPGHEGHADKNISVQISWFVHFAA